MTDPPKTLFAVLSQELKLRNYSPKTIKAYRSCLKSFVNHFAPRHPRELVKVGGHINCVEKYRNPKSEIRSNFE